MKATQEYINLRRDAYEDQKRATLAAMMMMTVGNITEEARKQYLCDLKFAAQTTNALLAYVLKEQKVEADNKPCGINCTCLLCAFIKSNYNP